MTTTIVTVDIGGTHARFALAEVAPGGEITLDEPATLHTRDHASFQTAWEDFARMRGGTLPPAVSIAIAGPVGGEVIRFTNNPWVIRPALIPEKLGADRYTVINDFGAVGHAVACASDDHFVHLAGPEEALPVSGTISIVGPGTGLGVAHIWRDGADYRVALAPEHRPRHRHQAIAGGISVIYLPGVARFPEAHQLAEAGIVHPDNFGLHHRHHNAQGA